MRKAIQLTDNIPTVNVRLDRFGRITGGLVVGDVLAQNQAMILTLHPGELKDSPVVGVGITDMLLDHNPSAWKGRIREQLELDGQTVETITIGHDGIDIAATHEE